MAFIRLNLEVELFKPIEHQLNTVHHYHNVQGKNTDIVYVKQKGDKLLVSWTLLHEVTEARAYVGQTKRNVEKLIEA